MRGGEGGPFYSPNRSVPRRDKGGNADSHLLEVKNDLPTKDEPEPLQLWVGRCMGSAKPLLRWFGPIFGQCTPCGPLVQDSRCPALVGLFALSNGPLLDV